MKALFVFAAVAVLMTAGCFSRPVFTWEQSAQVNGSAVYQSIPVTRGEVYFRGTQSSVLEAKISIDGYTPHDADGAELAPIRSGYTLYNVYVAEPGWHTIAAEIFLVDRDYAGKSVRRPLGRVERQFYVDPLHKDYGVTPGYWWRVEIGPYYYY